MICDASGRDCPSAGVHTHPLALRVTNISKRFGTVLANDRVSLSVRQGEIHAVLGENGAGKSTLMRIIFGQLRPDAGHMEIRGATANIRSPADALDLGIGMLHQEFVLVPNMTVAENLALAATKGQWGRSLVGHAARFIEKFVGRSGLAIGPNDLVGDLSIGAQQRVEILKLLYRGADILIFDEPSAVLTSQEWHELAATLRSLAEAGKSIILITHKLDEIFEVADRCTVLRQGKTVGETSIHEVTKTDLARMMVGREVVLRTERPEPVPGSAMLSVRQLSTSCFERTNLTEITFEVRAGEVVGIAGVEGNGQRELIEALTGLVPIASGSVQIAGSIIEDLTPEKFRRAGGGVVTEDRRGTGLGLTLSILDNLMLRQFSSRPFSRCGFLNRTALRQKAEELVRQFDIRCPSIDAPVGQLSGGNQQKVMIAREMQGETRLLIAAQPTRGLDVGAIEQIYKLLNAFKSSGGALLLISTELDEIFSLSDRIAVMSAGRLSPVLSAHEATIDRVGELMLMAAGESPRTGLTRHEAVAGALS